MILLSSVSIKCARTVQSTLQKDWLPGGLRKPLEFQGFNFNGLFLGSRFTAIVTVSGWIYLVPFVAIGVHEFRKDQYAIGIIKVRIQMGRDLGHNLPLLMNNI